MKIIVASGVESRPARRSAGDRDGHAHGTVLKSDREHGRAGGIGTFEKSQPFLAEIDLHDSTTKEILSQQTVDTARGRRIDLPEIENEDVIAQSHVTNLRGESADPASFGTVLDSDHPNGRSRPQALELARCPEFRALMPAPESSTNRSGVPVGVGLTVRQIIPSRNSKGISAPGLAQAETDKKTATSGSRKSRKNTGALCNASGGISTHGAEMRSKLEEPRTGIPGRLHNAERCQARFWRTLPFLHHRVSAAPFVF